MRVEVLTDNGHHKKTLRFKTRLDLLDALGEIAVENGGAIYDYGYMLEVRRLDGKIIARWRLFDNNPPKVIDPGNIAKADFTTPQAIAAMYTSIKAIATSLRLDVCELISAISDYAYKNKNA